MPPTRSNPPPKQTALGLSQTVRNTGLRLCCLLKRSLYSIPSRRNRWWINTPDCTVHYLRYLVRQVLARIPLTPEFRLKKQKRCTLGVLTIVKNEAPYLEEWIEYHRMLGVEHFWFYDNESTDNTREILAPYIEAGIVSYKFWPGQAQQYPAYQDFIHSAYRYTQWLAVMDVDEFFCPIHHNSIPEFIEFITQRYGRQPDSIGINWMIHGFNGHETKPEGLIIESYPKCDRATTTNKHVKSITRTDCILDVCNSHFLLCTPYAHYVDATGHRLDFGSYGFPHHTCETHWEHAILHHYWSRSYEEYVAKNAKGRIDNGKIAILQLRPYDPSYLSTDDDSTIQRFIAPLKERLAARHHEA